MVTVAGDSTESVDVPLERDGPVRRRRSVRRLPHGSTSTSIGAPDPESTNPNPRQTTRGNDILFGMDEFDSDRGR